VLRFRPQAHAFEGALGQGAGRTDVDAGAHIWQPDPAAAGPCRADDRLGRENDGDRRRSPTSAHTGRSGHKEYTGCSSVEEGSS